jgi:hypothetical protein
LYAKFGVDSRAALFALFLNHLITGDGESGRREG